MRRGPAGGNSPRLLRILCVTMTKPFEDQAGNPVDDPGRPPADRQQHHHQNGHLQREHQAGEPQLHPIPPADHRVPPRPQHHRRVTRLAVPADSRHYVGRMFAVYAAEPNHEDPLASLRIGNRPAPEVPDGHVVVTVTAASLNLHDLWTLRGVGITPEQFPMILGCDGAGVLPDGSEVVLHSVITSPGWIGDETLDPGRKLLTEHLQGTFADIVVVPARNVLPKPASLTFPEAGCLGTAWLTAYRMLFVKSGLRPGQTMLVQGASGGVSTALVQLGR